LAFLVISLRFRKNVFLGELARFSLFQSRLTRRYLFSFIYLHRKQLANPVTFKESTCRVGISRFRFFTLLS
jgi:hypothetical protein